jgi:hypothetical protein
VTQQHFSSTHPHVQHPGQTCNNTNSNIQPFLSFLIHQLSTQYHFQTPHTSTFYRQKSEKTFYIQKRLHRHQHSPQNFSNVTLRPNLSTYTFHRNRPLYSPLLHLDTPTPTSTHSPLPRHTHPYLDTPTPTSTHPPLLHNSCTLFRTHFFRFCRFPIDLLLLPFHLVSCMQQNVLHHLNALPKIIKI